MMNSFLLPRVVAVVLFAASTFAVPASAQRVTDGQLLLREALHKQQVEGDLAGAIKIYQQIVTTRKDDRATTATALFELANCYEKLGRQAEALYEQLVREFSDQPAATQARARLSARRPSPPAPTMTLRKIHVGAGLPNLIATDGERAVYWDETRTTLLLGDVAGKSAQPILATK